MIVTEKKYFQSYGYYHFFLALHIFDDSNRKIKFSKFWLMSFSFALRFFGDSKLKQIWHTISVNNRSTLILALLIIHWCLQKLNLHRVVNPVIIASHRETVSVYLPLGSKKWNNNNIFLFSFFAPRTLYLTYETDLTSRQE